MALSSHITSLCPRSQTYEEVGQVLEVLILVGREKDARLLQQALSELTQEQQIAADDISRNPPPSDAWSREKEDGSRLNGKSGGDVRWKYDILRGARLDDSRTQDWLKARCSELRISLCSLTNAVYMDIRFGLRCDVNTNAKVMGAQWTRARLLQTCKIFPGALIFTHNTRPHLSSIFCAALLHSRIIPFTISFSNPPSVVVWNSTQKNSIKIVTLWVGSSPRVFELSRFRFRCRCCWNPYM